jgi:hypothetical protein
VAAVLGAIDPRWAVLQAVPLAARCPGCGGVVDGGVVGAGGEGATTTTTTTIFNSNNNPAINIDSFSPDSCPHKRHRAAQRLQARWRGLHGRRAAAQRLLAQLEAEEEREWARELRRMEESEVLLRRAAWHRERQVETWVDRWSRARTDAAVVKIQRWWRRTVSVAPETPANQKIIAGLPPRSSSSSSSSASSRSGSLDSPPSTWSPAFSEERDSEAGDDDEEGIDPVAGNDDRDNASSGTATSPSSPRPSAFVHEVPPRSVHEPTAATAATAAPSHPHSSPVSSSLSSAAALSIRDIIETHGGRWGWSMPPLPVHSLAAPAARRDPTQCRAATAAIATTTAAAVNATAFTAAAVTATAATATATATATPGATKKNLRASISSSLQPDAAAEDARRALIQHPTLRRPAADRTEAPLPVDLGGELAALPTPLLRHLVRMLTAAVHQSSAMVVTALSDKDRLATERDTLRQRVEATIAVVVRQSTRTQSSGPKAKSQSNRP